MISLLKSTQNMLLKVNNLNYILIILGIIFQINCLYRDNRQLFNLDKIIMSNKYNVETKKEPIDFEKNSTRFTIIEAYYFKTVSESGNNNVDNTCIENKNLNYLVFMLEIRKNNLSEKQNMVNIVSAIVGQYREVSIEALALARNCNNYDFVKGTIQGLPVTKLSYKLKKGFFSYFIEYNDCIYLIMVDCTYAVANHELDITVLPNQIDSFVNFLFENR
jgi:hypothetical protein